MSDIPDTSTTSDTLPTVKLGPMQTYSAHITTGVKDLAGNALAAGANWTFRTQDGSWGFPSTPIFATSLFGFNAAVGRGCDVVLFPSLAVGPSGDAMAVWSQPVTTAEDIVVDRFVPGTGWGTPQLIEADSGNAFGPQVALDPAGNAVAVWAQSDGTRVNIVANRFTPAGNWGTPQIIDNDTVSDATGPAVELDAAGNAIAAWSQSDGTRTRFGRASVTWSSGNASGGFVQLERFE
jgi:hypothetical protein